MAGDVRERLTESRQALGAVVRNPGLRRINLAFAGSIIGDWAYAIAVSVYAYREGGAATVGLLGVVRYLAMATIGPFAATLADKIDRKRLMVTADLARTALVALAALLIAMDAPALPVFAIAVCSAVFGTAFRPAQAALLPRLVTHPSELTAANVVATTIESVGFFAGPALGGLLLAFTDVEVVFAFNAATFVWSAFMVTRLRVPAAAVEEESASEAAPEEQHASRSGEVVAGFREIALNRDLRVLTMLFCGQTIVAGASLVFGVAVAIDLLKIGEGGVGFLNAVTGIGGLVGGFLALMLAPRGRLAVDFGIGVLMWSLPLLLIPAVPEVGAALLGMAVIGLGNSLVDINAFTILQRLTRDEVMGRVFGAVESTLIAGMALGALAMPLLIETIGLRSGMAVIGAVVATLSVAALPRLRKIDTIALAPEGLDLIRSVAIFSPLPERTIERLARSAVVVPVAAGAAVFHQGDEGDRFYVVESGEADVVIDGRLATRVSPGGSFGEIALLRDLPRTATVTAVSPLVLRAIERRQFLAAVTGHNEASTRADHVVDLTLAADERALTTQQIDLQVEGVVEPTVAEPRAAEPRVVEPTVVAPAIVDGA